jgi:hypothetical protein
VTDPLYVVARAALLDALDALGGQRDAVVLVGAQAISNGAEQLAISAGGIVYTASARIEAAMAARLRHVGRQAFGVWALLFGGAHFFYVNLTAPLVPNGCRLRKSSGRMRPALAISRRALRL